MIKKFPSIANPDKHGYAFDSTVGFSANHVIHDYFRVFQTMGDGLIQHSADYAITSEFVADYLLSLTAAMLQDEELTETMRYRLSGGPRLSQIEFCASVVFRESDKEYSKRRWYSVELEKVSSNQDKRHDKRFQEISEWNDGSADAIYRMLRPDYADGLREYNAADAIRDWAMDQPKKWMDLPAIFLGWTKDPNQARQIRDAFEAARAAVSAYSYRTMAERSCEQYRERIEAAAPAAETIPPTAPQAID